MADVFFDINNDKRLDEEMLLAQGDNDLMPQGQWDQAPCLDRLFQEREVKVALVMHAEGSG